MRAEQLRPRHPRLATGILVLAFAAACVDKVLLPDATGRAVVGLRFDATIAAQAAPGGLSVDVRVGYDRRTQERIWIIERTIPVTDSLLAITLPIDIASCLADPVRVGASETCPLQLEIDLRNSTLALLDSERLGPFDVSASGTGMGPFSVNLDGRTPTGLVFSVQPTNTIVTTPITPAVRVTVHDASGNAVPGSTASVTLTLGANPGAAILSGVTTVAAIDGVATFPSLTLNRVAAGYTLVATSAGLSAENSGAFNVTAAPAATLSLSSGTDQSAIVGALLPQPIIVRVTDASGNGVAGTTLTFSVTGGGGSVTNTNVVSDASGFAQTTWRLGTIVGAQTVSASAAGLAGSPVIFGATATAAPSAQLSIATQPEGASSGINLATQPIVQVRDASGALVASSSASVTAAIASGTGSLSGTTTVTAVGGVATFANLRITGAGPHTLSFTSTGLASATSATFTVGQVGSQLVITTQPGGATSGVNFTVQPVVQVRDVSGTLVTGSTALVTAIIVNGTGALSGATTVAAVGGVATFTSLRITGGGSHTLAFASNALTSAVSANFTVVQTATQLGIVTQPAGANSDAVFITQPVVAVRDAPGAAVVGSTAAVTAAIASGPGILSGTTSVAAVNGVATFTNLRITGTGTHTLVFTSPGLTSATSGNIVVGPTPDPIVVTLAPTAVTTSGFTGNATINPQGVAGINYGFSLTVNAGPSCFATGSGTTLPGSPTSPVAVSTVETNWQAGDQIAYRVSATRPGGVAQQGNCVVFNLQPPVLQMTPGNLTFQAVQSAANPASQPVTMSVAPNGPLNSMGASISYGPGATGWLSVTVPPTASGPANITVQPQSTAFAPGTYSATVTVSGFFGTNGFPVSRQFVVSYQIQ